MITMLLPVYRKKEIVAFTKVDLADYKMSAQHRWGLAGGHVCTKMVEDGVRRTVYLSRYLEGLRFGDRREVDHRSRDPLNNCRSNLRVTTRAGNSENRSSQQGTSRFRGVSWNGKLGKWRAQVTKDGHQNYLGLFPTEEEAAEAARSYREAHLEFSVD